MIFNFKGNEIRNEHDINNITNKAHLFKKLYLLSPSWNSCQRQINSKKDIFFASKAAEQSGRNLIFIV